MFSGRHFKCFIPTYNTTINIIEKNDSGLVIARACYSLMVLTLRESSLPTQDAPQTQV